MRKLLVAGCGSIGRRHAENAAKFAKAAVFDVDADAAVAIAKRLGIPAVLSLEDALDWGAEGVVVATPSHAHLEVAETALKAGADVLIEKPLSDSMEGVAEFLATAEEFRRLVFVVCNMRFHPGVDAVRANLAGIGKPYFARAHYGNYLPDMRPGADYRKLYCASRSMGGGVILDAIHEIDYLMWLLGPVNAVLCHADKLSGLDIDVEDYANIVLRFESGVRAEIHLDYLQRCKRRGMEIAGEDGTLVWLSEGKQPEKCEVKIYRVSKRRWKTLLFSEALETGQMYERVLCEFVRALDGQPSSLLTGRQGAAVLATSLAAKRSALSGSITQPEKVP